MPWNRHSIAYRYFRCQSVWPRLCRYKRYNPNYISKFVLLPISVWDQRPQLIGKRKTRLRTFTANLPKSYSWPCESISWNVSGRNFWSCWRYYAYYWYSNVPPFLWYLTHNLRSRLNFMRWKIKNEGNSNSSTKKNRSCKSLPTTIFYNTTPHATSLYITDHDEILVF